MTTPAHHALHIAFLGGGNMAQALALGLLRPQGVVRAITVIEPLEPTRSQLAHRAGPMAEAADIALCITALEALEAQTPAPDWLVLAVKPQTAAAALESLKQLQPHWFSAGALLSVAAGLTVSQITSWVGHPRVVRSMPNTPALIGQGVSGLFAAESISPMQRRQAEMLLRAVGEVLWLEDESLLDAVTAVSGSGPAYCFLLAEAMEQAGVALGLSPEQASLLARHTVSGAGQLLEQSREPAELLRARVTSPGGTTAAALAVFEQEGFRAMVESALRAAHDRSRALSRG